MPQGLQQRLPVWLRRDLPIPSAERTYQILAENRLNTICESARCPNRSECYSHRTATFMILGNTCTRSCGFCAVNTGRGEILESDEPERVARAARELGLEYVVITSVGRDDLRDEGAGHFARTVEAVRKEIPGIRVEVLTPDFHARKELIGQIVGTGPAVYNHNMETVRRLQKSARPQAGYGRSLAVLQAVKDLDSEMTTKSGLMLGLGESREEVYQTAADLRSVGCDILTLGQYLRPGLNHLDVAEYIAPQVFDEMARELKSMGFLEVFAGPYVRSSYHAGETFLNLKSKSI